MSTVAINKINVGNLISISPSYRSSIKRVFNSLFEWKNLPEEIESRHIEGFLFDTGTIAFYKVVDKYYALPATLQKWDMYGDLVVGQVYSPYKGTFIEGEYKLTDENKQGLVSREPSDTAFDGEFIYNNIEKESTLLRVEPILTMLDLTFTSLRTDILNSRNIRLMYAKSTSKDYELKTTMNQIYNSNSPFFIINEGHATELRTEEFKSKSSAIELWTSIHSYEESLYKGVGLVYDVKGDKKERLITSEIETSNFESSHLLKSMLEIRKKAVERINKKFKLEIEVNLSSNAQEIVESLEEKENNKLGNNPNEKIEGQDN